MERKESKIPFVGLHAHSVASVFDGLGYPSEHMDFAEIFGFGAFVGGVAIYIICNIFGV